MQHVLRQAHMGGAWGFGGSVGTAAGAVDRATEGSIDTYCQRRQDYADFVIIVLPERQRYGDNHTCN